MSRAALEELVAALESQVSALLANQAETRRAKDWPRRGLRVAHTSYCLPHHSLGIVAI